MAVAVYVVLDRVDGISLSSGHQPGVGAVLSLEATDAATIAWLASNEIVLES